MKKAYTKRNHFWLYVLVLVIVALTAMFFGDKLLPDRQYSFSFSDIPAYSGTPYVILNENVPEFTDEDITVNSYEYYSPLDLYGRCGYAMACIGRDIMPTQERESISTVKPSGWVQAQYDFIDGESLYNRCHLIGFQLTGENANELNLITGTRYCNVQGMLPFENMVADYVKETGNHVLYRVTPVFSEQELVARGVQMEALSVEDSGQGICFHVYVYNNQPGVIIDYLTGSSHMEKATQSETSSGEETGYILNTSSRKFHSEACRQGQSVKETNKEMYFGDKEELIRQGYTPAKCCDP